MRELDACADDPSFLCQELENSELLEELLPAINWWKQVALELVCSRDGDLDYLFDNAVLDRMAELPTLLHDVLSSYSPLWAMMAQPYLFGHHLTCQEHVEPTELLKRYRLFTRHVGVLAKDIWPEANFDALLKLK